MKLAERTSALLSSVESYRDERCAALLEPAVAEARALVKAALGDARRRVTTAIDEERKRMQRDVGAVESSLATERRLLAQQHAVRLLGRAWSALRKALEARWAESDTREHWTASHLERARECLAHDREWRIRHHAAWTENERSGAADRLRSLGIRVVFERDTAIAAGFVVTCGHNVLDATLDGLLSDRSALEGRLLQCLEDTRA